jgi:hypothetical protein
MKLQIPIGGLIAKRIVSGRRHLDVPDQENPSTADISGLAGMAFA